VRLGVKLQIVHLVYFCIEFGFASSLWWSMTEPMHLSLRMDGIDPSDIRKWTSAVEAVNGINLAQGNCCVETEPGFQNIIEACDEAMRNDKNTYSHSSGVPELCEALADKLSGYNGINAISHPVHGNIAITVGATGAMSCVLDALVDPGDEVIYFKPYYNYHLKSLAMRGARPRFIPLSGPNWLFSPDDLERAYVPGVTRAIVVNTPCNPSGKVFSRQELQWVGEFCQRHNIWAITDEVYEFIVFDGSQHVSLASLPGMAERTVTIGSFSKMMAITGWRVGYVVAPSFLTARLRIANEMNYVCAPTPLQYALVESVRNWKQFTHLSSIYQAKRDILSSALTAADFIPQIPRGAYYILANFQALGFTNATKAVEEMIRQVGVGAVPGPAFYSAQMCKKGWAEIDLDDNSYSHGDSLMRFCFAFRDSGLHDASTRLRKLRNLR
jgi:aminotransferase